MKRDLLNKVIAISLSVLCCNQLLQAQQTATIDRSSYYKAISSADLDLINTAINTVNKSTEKNKQAFEGALIMKRAGLLKGPSNKLKEFKAGKQKLEDVLDKNKDNAELRFLRLIIQENAPKILGYHKELEEDHKYIVSNFNSIPEATQKVIRDYSKSSKELSPSDF